MRKVQLPNISKAKRKAGRQFGEVDMRGDFARYVTALMRHAERQLKEAGVWDFRRQAVDPVRKYLIEQGYDKEFVEKLNLMSTRPRGKKTGGPKPAR
jgi:hypothetical protein